MIANIKTFMKKNKKMLKATGLFVILFASVASLALATNFSLKGREIHLGQSLPEVSVDFECSGALFTKDLAVTLTLEDDVRYVDMTLPLGASETKATSLMPVEEDSGITILDVGPALKKSTFLGNSGGELGGSQDAQNPDTSPNLVATEATVEFDLPDPGTYLFKFYDAQNNYLGEASYPVAYNINDNALSIGLDTGFHMNFDSEIRFTANYEPSILGQKEKLIIYPPPWFTFSSTPPSTTSYKVSTKSLPIPTDYYASVPNSQIFVNSTNRPTNVGALIVEFEANETGALKFTFGITFQKLLTNARGQLAKMMVEYGTNPDQVPLVIVGVGSSMDGLQLVDTEVATYRSAYQNVDGTLAVTAPISYPLASSKISALTNWKRTNALSGSNVFGFLHQTGKDAWFYPISDMVLYFPNPQGLTLLDKNTPGSGPVTYMDKPYYKYVFPANANLEIYNIHPVHQQASNYKSTLDTPTNALIPGTVYELGDIFLDYTHMGVPHEGVKVTNYLDIVVPKFAAELKYLVEYRNPNMSDSWSRLHSRREQGLRDENFTRISFENDTGSQAVLAPLIEKPIITAEFPFETSPYKLDFFSRMGMPANDMVVSSIAYWLHEDPLTKHTLTFTAGDVSFSLPQSDTEHISKVEIGLNKIAPLAKSTLTFSNQHGTHDQNGQLLPQEFSGTIKTGIVSESGNAIASPESAAPQEIPFGPFTEDAPLQLYRLEAEDTLRFGRSRYEDDRDLELWHYNREGQVTGRQNYYFNGSSAWLKDYKDVEVVFFPQTENDKKLLSLLDRIYLYNLSDPNYPSIVKAFYKTNLDGSWRPAERQPTGLEFRFPLEPKEYLTEAKVNIDKIYGKTIGVANPSQETDNYADGGYGAINTYTSGLLTSISLEYTRDTRTYFTGSDDQMNIDTVPEKLTTEATVTIGDVAQFINSGSGASTIFNTNKTIISSTTQPYTAANLDRAPGLHPWTDTSVYQGGTVEVRYYNYAGTGGNPATPTSFPFDYDVTVYLEVLKDFDIIAVDQGKIREVRPIEGSENTLYIIDCKAGSGNIVSLNTHIYVHPNTPVTPVGERTQVFASTGVSHQPFKDKYMTPAGSYFDQAPYTKYTALNRPFPAHWKVTDVDLDMQFNISSNITLNIGEAFFDNIELTSSVSNRPQGKSPSFLQHEKEELMVEAYVGNTSTSNMGEFEATFTLPRGGGTTTSMKDGGGFEEKPNTYDLYLRGLPTSLNTLEELRFTYKDDVGGDVTLSSPPLAAELKKVKEIHVSFKNFIGGSMEIFHIPLYTDFVKTGSLVDPILGYVGASSRKRRDSWEAWPEYATAYALPVAYNSYTLDVGQGMDTTEVGTLTTRANNIGRAKVYYEENGQDVLLHTTTMGSNNLWVNLDVSKVTVEEVNPATVKLTRQNHTGKESNDSDFPEDTKTLLVDPADVRFARTNLYDAAFVPIPKLQLTNMSLIQDKSISQNYFYGWLWGANHGTEGFYTYEILDVTKPTIGDITIDYAAKKVNYLAKQVGETTYTVEVTNRLGFKFKQENLKLTVSPNVPFLVSVPKLDFGTHKLTGDSATRALALACSAEVQDLSGLARTWRVSAKATPLVNESNPSAIIPAETLQFVDKNGQGNKLDSSVLIWEENTLSTKTDYKKTFAAGASADSFLLKGLSPLLSLGSYTGTVTWGLELV